jgi:hypothetical protein
VDGDLGLLGGRPLKEEPEGDVVAVGGELPEQRGTVFVGRDSNRDRFSVADLCDAFKNYFYDKFLLFYRP